MANYYNRITGEARSENSVSSRDSKLLSIKTIAPNRQRQYQSSDGLWPQSVSQDYLIYTANCTGFSRDAFLAWEYPTIWVNLKYMYMAYTVFQI